MKPKFRAWDTHEEVMNRVDYVDFVNGVIGMSNENVRDYEQPIHRVNIMQYAGLKDKNGVEIYEGDIVDYFRKYKSIIEWRDGGFIIRREADGAYELIQDRLAEIEVMGNIYENKELLKEQNK